MDVKSDDEQPFPDSWIGTTAPVALGCLTDIATEMLEWYDATEGTEQMWPLIGNLIRRWCNRLHSADFADRVVWSLHSIRLGV